MTVAVSDDKRCDFPEDPSTLQTCGSVAGEPDAVQAFECPTGAEGQCVFVYVPDNPKSKGLVLCEVEIYGVTGMYLVIAKGHTLSQSEVTEATVNAWKWLSFFAYTFSDLEDEKWFNEGKGSTQKINLLSVFKF